MKVYDHHAKFRWDKWSCAAVTLVVLLILFLILHLTSAGTQHNRINTIKNTVMNNLCAKIKYESDLAAIIWSHRAALPPQQPNYSLDGSIENMKSLLSSGISCFDVDISILDGEDGTEPISFYVAHPSRLASAHKNPVEGHAAFQSVRPFLTQIAEYHHFSTLPSHDQQKHSHHPQPQPHSHHTDLTPVTRQLRPMVTIEPKFTDPLRIQQLVRIGNRHIYKDDHRLRHSSFSKG